MSSKQSINQEKFINVLFLCYGNACRSIMAEAIARHFWRHRIGICSAGLVPLGFVPPQTILVLQEQGIPTDGLHSKALTDCPLREVDYLINLTEIKLEGLIPSAFTGKVVTSFIQDPYGQDLYTYRSVRDQLKWLVTKKLPGILAL